MTEKAALRASAIFDLGGRFEDALEGAQTRASEARGSVSAFSQGARAAAALEAHVDRDVEEGKLSLEEAKIAKLWLGRSRAALENLGRQAEGLVLMTEGELRAWRATVEISKKTHELELAKVPRARLAPLEEVAPAAPDAGRRPSVKERRLAAEAAAQAASKPSKKAARKKAARKKAG